MDTRFADPPAPDAILEAIKDALAGCRQSSSRLYGFMRGLEIGAATIKGSTTGVDPLHSLQERSIRLSQSNVDYDLGISLGISLTIAIASKMLADKTRFRARIPFTPKS